MSSTANNHTIQLTDRDRQIILMAYEYDGIPNFLIRRRFWPGFGARSAFYNRVSDLIKAGYLRACPLPSFTGKGTGPSLLTIGPASHPILQRELGLDRAELRRLRHSFVPQFFVHECQVREFRLTLETACQGSPAVSFCEWFNESAIRRQPYKVALANQTLELVPDGVFTLTVSDGRPKTFYLELDRATLLSPARFKHKIAGYFGLLGESASPVLVVVPTEARRQQLSAWIGALAQELGVTQQIFAIGLWEQIFEQTILDAPVWQVVGGAPMGLLPAFPAPHAAAAPSSTQLPGGLPA